MTAGPVCAGVDEATVLGMLEVPPSAMLLDAVAGLRGPVHPAVFNHSARVFLHARAFRSHAVVADRDAPPLPMDLFLVACLFHDAGTAESHNGPARFEVEGADAAQRFLAGHGRSGREIDMVWEAIALHTSPGIAERRGPMTRHLRLGVLQDFGALPPADDAVSSAAESRFPRLDVERVLAGAVVAQALATPAKAPASSWAADLLRAHLADPGHPGLNRAF
jgi:HD domain